MKPYIKKMSLGINGKKYDCLFFNTLGLMNLIKKWPDLTSDFERKLQAMGMEVSMEYSLMELVLDELYSINKKEFYYFIIYYYDEVFATLRLGFTDSKSKIAHISNLYVDKLCRGEGFCKIMIKACMKITSKYFDKYILEVHTTNIPALKCYKKIGFKCIDKIKDEQQKFSPDEDVYYYTMEYIRK